MGLEFVKFSDERRRDYCIKTKIVKEVNNIRVSKEAIFDEGIAHIKRIVENKSILEEYFDYECCPVQFVDNCAVFDYIAGQSLADLYCDALEKGDIEEYERLLTIHKNFIIGKGRNKSQFAANEMCEKIFGISEEYTGKEALCCSNYDLIPENIIMNNGNATVIDYEWVFDFPIPLDYVIYHCIKIFYEKNQNAEKIYPLEKALVFMGVKENDTIKKSELCFYNYVSSDGKEEGFCIMKAICLKNTKKYEDIAAERVEAIRERDNALNELSMLEYHHNELLKRYRKTIRGFLGRVKRKLKNK